MKQSYFEASARGRIGGILDGGSFHEWLPPAARVTSPHLKVLDLPLAFDDGVVVGSATLDARPVLVAAQEGGFMGGAVGEVHGAKLTALIARALRDHPAAVVLLIETGGVRLQEANAGLIAVSEVMRAILAARSAGIPVIAAIGGQYGCFGGMGIAIACCDAIVMSEEGRLGLSGPEVIETAHGVEEFDSRDRALVWRTLGGKHRYLTGDCDALVDDDMAAYRGAIIQAIAGAQSLSLARVEQEHAMLAQRLAAFGDMQEPRDIWRALGVQHPEAVSMLSTGEFLAQADALRTP